MACGLERANLQISQLREPFRAAFKPAAVGLDSFMHDPMRLNIATLGKSSAAEITRVWTLPGVTAFVSLQWVSSCSSNAGISKDLKISELRKALSTRCFFADLD